MKGESTLIKTAIYNNLTIPLDVLKQLLKEYGIEHHRLVDVKAYDSASDLLAGPAAHIYFLKSGTYTEDNQLLGFAIRDKFPDALIVCIAEDANDAFLGYRFHAAACLAQPVQKSELEEILTDLENLIKEQFGYLEDISDLCSENLPDVFNTLKDASRIVFPSSRKDIGINP